MLSNISIAIKLIIKEPPLKLTNRNGVPLRENSPVIPHKFTADLILIAIILPNGFSHSYAVFKERRTIGKTPANIISTNIP